MQGPFLGHLPLQALFSLPSVLKGLQDKGRWSPRGSGQWMKG